MYQIENIKNTILLGDTLTELKKFPDESVDCIITSPPYFGLRKYGDYEQQIGLEPTFNEYLKKILEITAELKRVLKKEGTFFLNLGDCYGTEHPAGALGKYDKNPDRFAKVDNSEKGRAPGISKCLLMMPERIALKMIDGQGWILRNKIKWAKQVLDFKEKKTKGSVMPTSVKDRFNESGEELYFFVKNKKYYSDLDAVRLPLQTFENRPDGIVRSREYGYAGKIKFDISEKQKELVDGGVINASQRVRGFYDEFSGENNPLGKNLPTVWLIGSEPHNFQKELGVESDHFAIFPQALLEIPIKFGCPEKGMVLDPFMGAGTTALMARKLGRNFIGIELNSSYIEIAEKRLASVHPSLF